MIHSKKMFIISLLLVAAPLCAAPTAMKNQKKACLAQAFNGALTCSYAASVSTQPVVTMTTKQIMQQNPGILPTCPSSSLGQKAAASPGQTLNNVYPVLANYLETGSILSTTVTGAVGTTASTQVNQVLLGMDSRIRSFTYSSAASPSPTLVADQILDITPDQFFSVINNGEFVKNTVVSFDNLGGYWYVAATTIGTNQPASRMLLAVGEAPISASSFWSFTVVDSATNPAFTALASTGSGTAQPLWYNNLSLGWDSSNIYLTVQGGSNIDLIYNSSEIYALPKITPTYTTTQATVYAWRNVAEAFGGPGAASAPGNPIAPTSVTTVTDFYGYAPTNTAYMVGVSTLDYYATSSATYGPNANQGQLLLLTLNFSTALPTLSVQSVLVPPYYQSFNIPLTPPTVTVEPLPTRDLLRQAIGIGFNGILDNGVTNQPAADNLIYVCQEISVDYTGTSSPSADRNGVRFYAIPPANPSATIVNTLNDNTVPTLPPATPITPINYYSPSITTYSHGSNGNVVIGATIDGLSFNGYTGYLSLSATVANLFVSGIQPLTSPLTTSTTPYYPTDDWYADPVILWTAVTSTILDPSGNVWTFLPWGSNFAQGVWNIGAAQIIVPAESTKAAAKQHPTKKVVTPLKK